MKNNKGFTFVELIAVLVIIVILFVVSLPPIMRIFKSTQLKVDEGIRKIIEDGTKDLLVNETASYDNNDTNKYCIKISELIEKGYITEELVKDIDKDVFSVVTFEKNKPKVELHTTCVEEINNIYFVLKGDKETNVTLGSTYSDPGVEAYDKQGNNIAGNVKTYITDERLVEQPIVDTSII
jgi:prepilin-type N-terminal cleavage/methylation domain-containing protein